MKQQFSRHWIYQAMKDGDLWEKEDIRWSQLLPKVCALLFSLWYMEGELRMILENLFSWDGTGNLRGPRWLEFAGQSNAEERIEREGERERERSGELQRDPLDYSPENWSARVCMHVKKLPEVGERMFQTIRGNSTQYSQKAKSSQHEKCHNSWGFG